MNHAGPRPFRLDSARLEAGLCIKVSGELDLSHSPRLVAALDRALLEREPVTLDLRDCELLDTSAIAAMLKARHRLHACGRECALLIPRAGVVRRQLEVLGLADWPVLSG